MKPETYLRRKILLMLRNEFPQAWVYHPADRFVSGVPDFLICLRGFFVAMEVKTSTGHVSKLQRFTLDKITGARGIAVVVRSVDEARKHLTAVGEVVS